MWSTQYPLTLCMMVTQLATQIDFREKIIPIAFWVTRSRSNFWSLSKHCQVNILGTIRMIITKRRTVGANSEWIIHCILVCATLWDFAPGGGGIYVSCSFNVPYPCCL